MADSGHRPLSDWLELMLAEIARRDEEAQAADVERAARATQPNASSPSSAAGTAHRRGAGNRATHA